MDIRDRLQSEWALACLFWLALAVSMCWPVLQGAPVPLTIDNGMRMLEANDLFKGQAWWDTTQYRDNVPLGGPMHWSRLIDGPIAVLIALFTPVLGGAAFTAAAVAWPMLVLLGLALAMVGLTRQLVDRPGPLLVLLIAALSLPIYQDFSPGKVDHHNVQYVLALLTILCVIKARANQRWAIVAGCATATIVAIGAEGMPMVAAALVVVPLYWVAEPEANRKPLIGFAVAFAIAVLLHLSVQLPPSQWFAEHCDAISFTYATGGLAYAAAILVSAFGGERLPRPWQRFAALVATGGVAIGVTLWLNPDCIRGPYGNLDPLLAAILLDPVIEAQPVTIWLKPLQPHASLLLVPIAGLVATALAAWHDRPRRVAWLVLLAFGLAAILVTIAQIRGIRLATLVVLPAGAWAITVTWRRFHLSQSLWDGLGAGLTCLLFMNVLHYLSAWSLFPPPAAAPALTHEDTYTACVAPENFQHLASLPKGRAISHLHLGTPILLHSPHSIVAAGFHRNVEGLRAAIDFFSGNEQKALTVARDRRLDYLVFCKGISPEYGLEGLPPFVGTDWPWLTRLTTPDEPVQIYAIEPPASGNTPL